MTNSSLDTVAWHYDLEDNYVYIFIQYIHIINTHFIIRALQFTQYTVLYFAFEVCLYALFYTHTIYQSLLHTMLFEFGAHFLNMASERPACSIPGVANTTMEPGLSMYDLSNGLICLKSNMLRCTKVRRIFWFVQVINIR